MSSLCSCSRGTSTTVTSDVEPCTTARLTTKMSLVSRRATSSSSSPRRPRTTTGWRGSSSQSPTVVDSSPPPLSTCYQTDHQPCPGTSEELTREDNQERQSPCPAVCVIPPTPPVCACGGTVKVEGGPLSPGGRPTLLTQQAGTHPPFPATWPHDHPAGPTTTTWEPPDHQVPPESLKQGQELAIPTSAAVAVSAPVMTLALVLVRQKPGGFVPRLALARSLVPTRNTFLPHLHTHTTTMPTPLTLAEPRLPWELFLLQVPREPPVWVGGQARGTGA